MKHLFLFSAVLIAMVPRTIAQCGAGEVEVSIAVTTDDFGYETYWQLVPGGNPCGTGTIFDGGNMTMNCGSGGLQLQQMSGYGNNTTYTEGPWCLTEGAIYDIYSVDDWGDAQAAFEVFVNGYSVGQFQGPGSTNVYSFTAQEPVARDMGVTELNTPLYGFPGDALVVTGTIRSFGTDVVTQFDLLYSIDAGVPVSAAITGVNLSSGDSYAFEHPTPWTTGAAGSHTLEVWAENINGGSDLNTANDGMSADLTTNVPIPNNIDLMLAMDPVIETIANSNQDLLVPRDLDFHPDLSRNELWVINKDTEASGGSTVKFTDVGEPGMTWLWQRDPDAWHFMSLPTGIAFGDNGNFSTCPGVFDANHNGGTPFTGISLWNSDPAIYAQDLFGPLGSHIDMLHLTPNAQGIAHERWNRYWVVDGYNGDVVMSDFLHDHGPGNDFHGNAIIRRYDDDQITRDPNDHIVSHCVFDKATRWLYVVDFGGQRVFRINTTTGTVSGPGDFGPFETYDEYTMVTGYVQENIITSGLVQPAGIDIIGDRLLVSDHSNGDIVVYDLNSGAVEIGRIHTLVPGIMGIKVGPDGSLWYVNATTHELGRISADPAAGIAETPAPSWAVVPNPAQDMVWLTGIADDGAEAVLFDATGRVVLHTRAGEFREGLDVSSLAPGTYHLRVNGTVGKVMVRH